MKVTIPNSFKLVAVQGEGQDGENEGRVNDDAKRDVVLDECFDDHPGDAAEREAYDAGECVHSFPARVVVLIIVPKVGKDSARQNHVVDGNP